MWKFKHFDSSLAPSTECISSHQAVRHRTRSKIQFFSFKLKISEWEIVMKNEIDRPSALSKTVVLCDGNLYLKRAATLLTSYPQILAE